MVGARLSELKQEAEWRKCVNDEKYFLRNYWHIAHPAYGRILFDLRDAQSQALDRWADNRYSLTLKARQIGWSTLVAAHQFWLAFFHPDQNIIDLSRTEREAVLLLRKTKYGMKHLPTWMVARGPKSEVEHQQRMAFSNSSQITSMPSASDPARGESATLIVVDEWAFLPNPEEAWASIEPVADVGGRIIGLSTANGSGNFFITCGLVRLLAITNLILCFLLGLRQKIVMRLGMRQNNNLCCRGSWLKSTLLRLKRRLSVQVILYLI